MNSIPKAKVSAQICLVSRLIYKKKKVKKWLMRLKNNEFSSKFRKQNLTYVRNF